jgi:hypothetical protein
MVEAVMLQESVIVAGHPRSGTSLTCQLVESAGVTFPSDFDGDDYNQAGYYELERSKELSKDLIDEAMTEDNTREMNNLVRRLNDLDGLSGLKIVRIPALFFYRHIAKDLRVVFVYRHPANVKASLLKRGISEFPISWYDNNNAIVAAYENIERSIVVSYDALLNREGHVEQGFEKLGLNVDMDLASEDQRTQSNSRMCVTRDEEKVYERLQTLEEESCSGGTSSSLFF